MTNSGRPTTDIMMKLGTEESACFHLDFKERCDSVE